ncbi:very short patch repair endonuclease [Lysobacter humi (ex Lee et al. 2017)]
MVDRLDPTSRSRLMSRIRGKDTTPEWQVRRAAHALGYRHRLHRKDLPGTPDLVFPGLRKVIFVNGCYWHRHESCKKAYQPKSNIPFWSAKFARNVERDRRAVEQLEADGWGCLIIWECETASPEHLRARLIEFLGPKCGSTRDKAP